LHGSSELDKQPKPEEIPMIEADPDTLYYIDYTCPHCGQRGTARFPGNQMKFSVDDEYFVAKKTIYCCQCRKGGMEIETVAEC